MKAARDEVIRYAIRQKEYVINYFKQEKDLNINEIQLLDQAINLLLFNQMVSLDGGDDFSEDFKVSIIDLKSGIDIIGTNDAAFHERLFELDEEN